MAEIETGFFRGAGGGVFELQLPLSENFENQRVRGQLVRVNEDGSHYEEPRDEDDADGQGDELVPPAKNASKDEWVGYALKVDPELTVDDADAMTRNDLIEKCGAK